MHGNSGKFKIENVQEVYPTAHQQNQNLIKPEDVQEKNILFHLPTLYFEKCFYVFLKKATFV